MCLKNVGSEARMRTKLISGVVKFPRQSENLNLSVRYVDGGISISLQLLSGGKISPGCVAMEPISKKLEFVFISEIFSLRAELECMG
ncbi:hypothetical protein SAMN05192563_104339 [Paraburkholderia aspalathi]|uniref:Uncharacterized protein n=1 Tax=Paraburkholderia aspalathi TaxID=1324617 RepID=A0A1I7EPQ6_9BURK|nr:hypothetical protein SAMN05192563_104339 [Paraburkholderia aspalathi]